MSIRPTNTGASSSFFNSKKCCLTVVVTLLALALRERGLPPDAFTVMAIDETRVLSARPTP